MSIFIGMQFHQTWLCKLLEPANILTVGHAMFDQNRVAGFEIKSIRIWDLWVTKLGELMIKWPFLLELNPQTSM